MGDGPRDSASLSQFAYRTNEVVTRVGIINRPQGQSLLSGVTVTQSSVGSVHLRGSGVFRRGPPVPLGSGEGHSSSLPKSKGVAGLGAQGLAGRGQDFPGSCTDLGNGR